MTGKRVRCLAVTGPTATGKTALAVDLARSFNGEVVSVDSRQVYRGMDIGSGKDREEYGDTPVHLLDIADPASEVYNLGRFCRDAFAAISDIAARGRLPVLCGGTALYLAALLCDYRLPGGELPPARDLHDRRLRRDPALPPSFEPPFKLETLVLGVYYPRREVRERIAQRLDARLAAGLPEEVAQLHRAGVSWEQLEFFGLEYREVARYLRGEGDFSAMREMLLNRIRQFAKRQDIFFRKLEREGVAIHWIERGDREQAKQLTGDFLSGKALPAPVFRLCDHRNPPSAD